jgi:cyclophilin family peptidyl-prolyl cis-trans isomerase
VSDIASPLVTIETSMGTMTARLWEQKAPKTVANFLAYVDQGFYDGLIFHRVIDGFMVQGGGMTPDMKPKAAGAPVKNEASADKPNRRGTLAMARTSDVHSATAQFFINHKDNAFLNHKAPTPDGFGYCAFGELTEGLEVLDAIAAVPTRTRGHHDDVPATPVVIQAIRRAQ